jgi:hypothetical protein
VTDRLDVARAWRRALLGDDDKLHEDGKLIMADLEQVRRPRRAVLSRCMDGMRRIDPMQLVAFEGARNLLKHIKNQLMIRPPEPKPELPPAGSME